MVPYSAKDVSLYIMPLTIHSNRLNASFAKRSSKLSSMKKKSLGISLVQGRSELALHQVEAKNGKS